MLIVTASCVVVLAGMVAWPSLDMSVVALCVPVYWLGRICLGAYHALRSDRPSMANFGPALIGSAGVLLILAAIVGTIAGTIGLVLRVLPR